MDTRFMLMAIYSKEARLERVAGIPEVVHLLLQYTSCDKVWKKWCLSLQSTRDLLIPSNITLQHFLKRLRYYPRISAVEHHTLHLLIQHIRKRLSTNYCLCQISENYYNIVSQIFDVLKQQPVQNDHLILDIFRLQGSLTIKNRFGKKEIEQMNFKALALEGIEIIQLHNDFRGCDVLLTMSTHEWTKISLRIPADYPFRCPMIEFLGSLRPKRFAAFKQIAIDDHYDYAFTTVESVLRVLLLTMYEEGIVSTDNLEAKVCFV